MALIEKDGQDIATCRSKVEYIVVAEHRKSSQEKDKSFNDYGFG